MYIIVSAAHPRHCQPACILPVSKLPGTWREKLRAITEPPLRGVSSLRAQQPDSVSMGTLLWPLGCCWHHLMYIFRYKTSPFISEIVFDGLKASSCHRKKIPSAHSDAFFSLDSSPGKLKPFDLEAHNKESYFIQSESYMTAARND